MKMKKYLMAFVFTLLCAMMLQPIDAKATTTFEEIKVHVVDDMTNFDRAVGLSWQIDWTLDKNANVKEQWKYAKFTLTEKSFVHIKTVVANEDSFAAKEYFRVYANESMGSPIVENGISYGSGNDYLLLDAGTYYIECGSELYMDSASNHSTKVMIGAVPADKAIEVTQVSSANGKKKIITVKQKFAEQLRIAKWCEGKTDYVTSYNPGKFDENDSFTVDKKGWYTVYIQTQNTDGEELGHFIHINVTELGAGAKTGVTYKSGNLKYKLVKKGFDGKGTVMVTGIVKQKTSVTIPKTVKIGGHSYKVVKINNNAFKNKSKLKKITIKTTYLTSVGKNAIKGINKKAVIKVPKSKVTAYKKLFKSKTGYKKTMKITK